MKKFIFCAVVTLLDFTKQIVTWSLCAPSGFLNDREILNFHYPLKYNLILTEKRTALIIFLQWMSGTFFGIVPVVYRRHRFWYTVTLSVLGCSNFVMVFAYHRLEK